MAKSAIVDNNRITIGEQRNAIQSVYNLLPTEFRDMCAVTFVYSATPDKIHDQSNTMASSLKKSFKTKEKV